MRLGKLRVVIAGGGVAGLETALALRALAGDRVKLTLLTPATDFVYRPSAVLEPFVHMPPSQLSLQTFAAELGGTLVCDTVAAVDCRQRVIRTAGDRKVAYDALVIAVGARTSDVLPDTVAMRVSRIDESLPGLIEEIEEGSVRRLALVALGPTWPLPLYEVALLVKEHAREKNIDLAVTIITSEPSPLAVFGEGVSGGVADVLAENEIQTIAGARAVSASGELIVNPGERRVPFDRIAALPQLAGPEIPGLPADADGFLTVAASGEVIGIERVFAAGDVTDFPIKFGGIAALQADAAAASIAALAGAPAVPLPFDGVVHGTVIAGHERRLYFTARIEGGVTRESRASDEPTWPPEAKVSARFLGPYLDDLWGAEGPRLIAGQLWETAMRVRPSK
jgi:sulfide:quinone oxidoreductase